MVSPFRSLIVTWKTSFAGDDMRNTQVRSVVVVKVSVESPVPSKVYVFEGPGAGVAGVSSAVVVTGAVVIAGAGVAGTVVTSGTGAGGDAGEGPVHPARLTTLFHGQCLRQ